MDNVPDIVPMQARRYEAIPVDKIKVINPRNRDAEQFEMNVESIDHVGLMKPIRVNDKFLERTGMYELICGEGRLLAHQRLGRDDGRRPRWSPAPARRPTCSRWSKTSPAPSRAAWSSPGN